MFKAKEASAWLMPELSTDVPESTELRKFQSALSEVLGRLEKLVPPDSVLSVSHMQEEIGDFSARISLIGQVKAGKTALTNALIGRPDLLPSDVNPWTSVITTVHMNTRQPMGKNAVFTFFSTEEWDRMVSVGGYLGEMAQRANYEEELVELREQIQVMQARTKERLGRNFNLLLDGYHSFLGFTPDLIKKYVCLGDEDEKSDGRYADITRSAELHIENNDYVLPTVICDTPGVNDPFLLREAVTLDNLSNTDICVVVLSAHQALSTVDIGLLRILLALKHKELVLFVNRIDELQDPDNQIIEIDNFIREILEEHGMPKDLPVIFGSAAWGEVAVTGSADEESEQRLTAFATARAARLTQSKPQDVTAVVPGSAERTATKSADLSGLHELKSVLQEKSAVKVGRPVFDAVRSQALDVAQQSLLYLRQASENKSPLRDDLDFNAFIDELDDTLKEADEACIAIANQLSEKVLFMMSAAFRDFMLTGKASLNAHVAAKKNIRDWRPDSDKLRRDLNLAHDEFTSTAPKGVNDVFSTIASRVEKIYGLVLNENTKLFSVNPPLSDSPKTPIALMRTMAIDMDAGWFSNWFSSKFNQVSFIKKFEAISRAEMQTTLKEMQDVYVVAFVKTVRAKLHDFLLEHIQTLQNLSLLGGEAQRVEVMRQLGVDTEIRQRIAELQAVVTDIESLSHGTTQTKMTNAKSVALG